MKDRIAQSTFVINAELLRSVTTRRSSGESLKALAAEAGVSWQELWCLIDGGVRPSTPKASTSTPKAAQRPAGPLTERYRPTTLADIAGQQEAVDVLTKFVQAPYSASFVFDGETGTGKTSAALALVQKKHGRRGRGRVISHRNISGNSFSGPTESAPSVPR